MRRSPAVAGQFYYDEPSRLTQQVKQFINEKTGKEDSVGIVVPHAGLIYSGSVAGAVYSAINFPDTFLMIGPNHTGLGPSISIMDTGEWQVPTGIVSIDSKLASRIIFNTTLVVRDVQAHLFEHSLEVQLPFIAYLSNEAKIVPIAMRSASFNECISLAESIANAIRSIDYPVTVLASSDMSHYLPDKTARLKDSKAMEKILNIDPEGLYDLVVKDKLSMCGYLPITVMLSASKFLGATTARLVKYMTSGEVSGDYDSVVGYAGIILKLK